MHTITNLANTANLPRRTVQYWHDRGVIEPLSTAPVAYSDQEAVLVRILGALTQSKPALDTVKELSRVLRLCLSGDKSVPADVAKAFEAAKNGEPAYFGIALSLMSDGDTLWPWTFGARGEPRLREAVVEKLRAHPNLGLTIVDLKYCFSGGIGTVFD